jgi:hypothetical protein
MSEPFEIVALAAPVADAALAELAEVLVDCVEGGASVNFMSPYSHDEALVFFRKVANSVAAGDIVLLAARCDGKIVGTVQLGLDTPPNQRHRADIKKNAGTSLGARPRHWRGLDGSGRGGSASAWPVARRARYRAG